MEVALYDSSRLTRHEPAALFVLGTISLPAYCYLTRFGSPRMGCVSSRRFSPADVHRRTRSAAHWRLGRTCSRPTIYSSGARKRLWRTRGWLYERLSASRRHILERAREVVFWVAQRLGKRDLSAHCGGHLPFQARQGLGYGATLFFPHDSTTAKQGASHGVTPSLPHGSPERRAAATAAERSPYPRILTQANH